MEDENFANIPRYIMAVLALVLWLYVFCEFGQQTTQCFDDLHGTVFGMDWYLLPIEMQKTIPMIISMAQKEVHIQGFGNFHSTREVFMKVNFSEIRNMVKYRCNLSILLYFQIMKTSFSYFLVLRH